MWRTSFRNVALLWPIEVEVYLKNFVAKKDFHLLTCITFLIISKYKLTNIFPHLGYAHQNIKNGNCINKHNSLNSKYGQNIHFV